MSCLALPHCTRTGQNRSLPETQKGDPCLCSDICSAHRASDGKTCFGKGKGSSRGMGQHEDAHRLMD